MWTRNHEIKAQHIAEYLHLSAASESRIQTVLKAVCQDGMNQPLVSTYRSKRGQAVPPGGKRWIYEFFQVLMVRKFSIRNEPLPLKKCLIGSHGPKTSVNEFKSKFVILESRRSSLSLAGFINKLSAVTILIRLTVKSRLPFCFLRSPVRPSCTSSSNWWEMPQRSCFSRPCPQRWRWSLSRTGGRRCWAGRAPPGGQSAGKTGSPETSRTFCSSSSAGWEPGRSSPGGRRRGEWPLAEKIKLRSSHMQVCSTATIKILNPPSHVRSKSSAPHLFIDVLQQGSPSALRLSPVLTLLLVQGVGVSEVGLGVDVVEAGLRHNQLPVHELDILQEGQPLLPLPPRDLLALNTTSSRDRSCDETTCSHQENKQSKLISRRKCRIQCQRRERSLLWNNNEK